jgi:hypothetical protein
MRLFSYNVHTIFTNEEGDFSQSGIANGSTALWADNAPYEAFVSTFHSPASSSVNNIKVFTRLIPDSTPPQITNFSFFGSINNTIYNKRSYTLFVGTTDTIGIESASFYYKIPNSSEWVLIGSAPSYNRIEAILSWYIPETFIGSGYQFKTVVRDFQGNTSESILNSLVIQEGNAAPTIQLLAPNEAEITVDTSLTIVWEDEDMDNNARINILYDTDNIPGSATIIHSGISEDSPTDQYVWDTTNIPAGNYYIAISITDDFNNHVWSYAEHPITIFHSTVINPPPPPPQNIPPTITITNPDGFVDIANLKFIIKWSALDPDDNALIDVYYDTNNFGEDGMLIANNLFENTATSTEWNTSQIPASKYYIYAKIRDNINTPVTTYGTYPVQVRRGGK